MGEGLTEIEYNDNADKGIDMSAAVQNLLIFTCEIVHLCVNLKKRLMIEYSMVINQAYCIIEMSPLASRANIRLLIRLSSEML